MHTSSLCADGDFEFSIYRGRMAKSGVNEPGQSNFAVTDFRAFWPDYSRAERVGIVAPSTNVCVLYAGSALLALAHAFYSDIRSERGPVRGIDRPSAALNGYGFLDWPPHIVLLTDATGSDNLRDLDVFPTETKVIQCQPAAIMKAIVEHQINRLLFHRSDTLPSQDGPYAYYQVFRTRFRTVYEFGDALRNIAADHGTMQVKLRPGSQSEAIRSGVLSSLKETSPPLDIYRVIQTDEFLAQQNIGPSEMRGYRQPSWGR